MFINETWHHEGQSRTLPNKKYTVLLSTSAEERGGGVAIIHRSDWIVKPLFPEFHCRNFILARPKTHPESLYAWSNLGASRFQVMRYDQARDAFEHAVKLKPDDAFAVFYLGVTYYQLETFDKALATLKTALQLVPNDANVHYFLGVTYASLRQQKEADAEFQKTKDLQLKAVASASH